LEALVAAKLGFEVTPKFVIGVLQSQEHFEWLDKVGGWFWLRTASRNRVTNRIRKILAVGPEIEVSELRSGISRHHAMKGYAPPRRVLLALCQRLPYCHVDGTWIRATQPIDWRHLLKKAEYTMVQILMDHGPVMQRAQFESLCLAAGMNRSTFYV